MHEISSRNMLSTEAIFNTLFVTILWKKKTEIKLSDIPHPPGEPSLYPINNQSPRTLM